MEKNKKNKQTEDKTQKLKEKKYADIKLTKGEHNTLDYHIGVMNKANLSVYDIRQQVITHINSDLKIGFSLISIYLQCEGQSLDQQDKDMVKIKESLKEMVDISEKLENEDDK